MKITDRYDRTRGAKVNAAGAILVGGDRANPVYVDDSPDFPEGYGSFSQFADSVGDGTGTRNLIGDYSAAGGQEFFFQAPAGQVYDIHRMIVAIRDTGNFSSNNYGGLGAPLTNGVQIRLVDPDDNIITNITDGIPIKSNVEWGHFCYDVQYIAFGTGDNHVLVRWSFDASGRPVKVRDGFKLVVHLEDNFTGLVEHYFNFQGHRIS